MTENQAQEVILLLTNLVAEMKDIKRLLKAGERRERGYETALLPTETGAYCWDEKGYTKGRRS